MAPAPTPERSADEAYAAFRRDGSARAMAELFDRTAPALLLLARRLAHGDAVVAEDLVQQTFVAAIERADTFADGRPVVPWLTGILANEARGRRRAEARRGRREAAVAHRDDAASDRERPDVKAQDREAREAMQRALAELAEPYRHVVELKLLHDLRPRQIAASLAIPVETVRTRFRRGLGQLVERLPAGLGLGAAVAATSGAGLRAARMQVLRTAAPASGSVAAAISWIGGFLVTSKIACAWVLVVLAGFSLWWIQGAEVPGGSGLPPSGTDAAGALAGVVSGRSGHAADAAKSVDEDAVAVRSGAPDVRAADLVLPSTVLCEFVWKGIGEAAVGIPCDLLFHARAPVARRMTDARGQVGFDVSGLPFARVLEALPDSVPANLPDGVPAARWPEEWLRSRLSLRVPLMEGRRVGLERDPSDRSLLRARVELDPGVELCGRVVDTRAAPVGGAAVLVLLDQFPEVEFARSAADGRFVLRGLPPGGFTVRAARAGRTSGTLRAVDVAGSEDDVVLELARAASALTVLVEDEQGRPVADASVFADATDHPVEDVARMTDAAGRAVFDGLVPARYRLKVKHARHPLAVADFESAGPGPEPGASGRPAAREATLRVVLGPSATIRGRVVHSNGTPAAGMVVRPRVSDSGLTYGDEAYTDEDGRFSLQEQPVGRYRFFVGVSVRNGHVTAEQTIHAGEQDLVLEIVHPTLVRGRLVAEDGSPLAGWRVRVGSEFGSVESPSDRTGDDGVFELVCHGRVGAGRLQVEAPADRGTGHVFPDVDASGSVRDYVVPDASRLPPGGVVGRITNAPEGCSVWLAGINGGRGLDAQGRFRLDDVPAGSGYRLGIRADGREVWLPGAVEVPSGETVDLGALRLPERDGVLVVEVAGLPAPAAARGADLDHWLLVVQEGVPGAERFAGTKMLPQTEHTWRLDGLASGPYEVRLVPDPAWDAERAVAAVVRRVEVRSGGEPTRLVLPTEVVGRARFRIEATPPADGGDLAEQTLRIRAGGVVVWKRTWGGPASGRFELGPGTYRFEYTATSGYRGEGSFVLPTPDGGPVVLHVRKP